MADISTPISFGLGIVSGIRLTSTGVTNQAYHMQYLGTGHKTYFQFSQTVQPIPLPAALPLLAGGLGFLGLMGWRRRKGSAA